MTTSQAFGRSSAGPLSPSSAISLFNDQVRGLLKLIASYSRIARREALKCHRIAGRAIGIRDVGIWPHIVRNELTSLCHAEIVRFSKRYALGFVAASSYRGKTLSESISVRSRRQNAGAGSAPSQHLGAAKNNQNSRSKMPLEIPLRGAFRNLGLSARRTMKPRLIASGPEPTPWKPS